MFSQAPGASRSQHRLSSFLLTKYVLRGCNVAGCANTNVHRPTNTRILHASPLQEPGAVLSEVEQRNYVRGFSVSSLFAASLLATRH